MELDKWYEEAYRAVDHFHERKKQEFQEYLEKQRTKQKTKLDQLRHETNALIQEEEATSENISSIKHRLRSLQRQTDQPNSDSLPFTLSPLVIDDPLLTIYHHRFRLNDLLTLPPLSRTTDERINFDCLTANNNYLSVTISDHFCLLDQHLVCQLKIPWTHDYLWDIVWSKALEQFLLITAEEIYVFDEKSMTIEQSPVIPNNNKVNWWCGTCSHNTLFVSAMGRGLLFSNIVFDRELNLSKNINHPYRVLRMKKLMIFYRTMTH